MTTSTATTTRRHPVRTVHGAPAANRRLADHESQELATRGATALAPDPARRPNTGTTPKSGNSKRQPGLRVAPPAPVSVARAPFVALVLVVVVAGVLGILVLNTKINENAFTLNHLQDQQSRLDQQEQQLDQHLAELESPNSLSAAAHRLGLISSGTPAYLPLPNGQSVGVPQPAAASGQPGR